MINKYAEWVVKSGLSHLYTHFSGILHPIAFEFDTEETVFQSLNGYKCDFKNSMLNFRGEGGNPQLNVFEFSFRREDLLKTTQQWPIPLWIFYTSLVP